MLKATSETETKIEYRYTFDHLSSRVFVSLLINFRDLVKHEAEDMAREKAQVKLGKISSLLTPSEDEEEVVHQELPLDALVLREWWIDCCCHCFHYH